MTPRVTVLLPVHDGADYLGEAIASVLEQTYADFELLVVDDGSSDASADVAASFRDPRIRVLRNESNLGLVPTLNRGLAEAHGEIVARLDHDDVALPRRLELQVAALDREPGVGVVGTWLELVDERGARIGAIESRIDDRVSFVFWALVGYILISHPAAAYRRALALEVGGYTADAWPAEDKDLWNRFLLAGADARIVPERLVRYRVHSGQISQRTTVRQGDATARVHESLLSALRPGAPVRLLRLLLTANPGLWAEVRDGAALAEELTALLTAVRARLALGDAEAAEVERRIAARVTEAVALGWRGEPAGWRRAGGPLAAWAGAGGRYRAARAAAPVLRPLDRTARRAAVRARRAVGGRAPRVPWLRGLYGRIIGSR